MHSLQHVYSILFFIDMFVLLRVSKLKVLCFNNFGCEGDYQFAWNQSVFAVDDGRCLVRFFIDD